MKIGFYAGSFDPFTMGHLYVVEKSAKLFDKIVIGIGTHPEKIRRFDKDLMHQAITQVLIHKNLNNVIVTSYENLTVDTASKFNCNLLIRGIRNDKDYEYEKQLASINKELSGIDTFYISAGSLGNISSSMVMELLQDNKDVSKYLPEEVLYLIKN